MMRHKIIWIGLWAPLLAGAAAPEKSTVVTPPLPLPMIRGIELRPAQLTLTDIRDERRVLVLGKTDGSNFVDLTAQAVFKTESPVVEMIGAYVRAKQKGDGTVFVSAAGQTSILPVTVESAETPNVRFVRDIEPLIAKLGCNAGTCHGSAKGKNGFKLSLRGYDPDFDYHALINDISGRRFNRVNPDDSLMLLKPLA
ncbi:MAG TPA: hypothetical protein VGF13_00015, partial [Verrucomicrobiae bacterium]